MLAVVGWNRLPPARYANERCDKLNRIERLAVCVSNPVGKKLIGDRRKGRINVMGGVRSTDKKRWVDFIPTGNYVNFYLVLQNFYEDLKQEWIELGNSAKDFQ